MIFYTKGLGLELKQRWDSHYAEVTAPGVVIGLHPAKETDNATTGLSIGFGVDSLAEAEKRLKELSVSMKLLKIRQISLLTLKIPMVHCYTSWNQLLSGELFVAGSCYKPRGTHVCYRRKLAVVGNKRSWKPADRKLVTAN